MPKNALNFFFLSIFYEGGTSQVPKFFSKHLDQNHVLSAQSGGIKHKIL